MPALDYEGDINDLNDVLQVILRTAGYPTEMDFHIRTKNKHGEEATLVLRIEF